MATNFQHFGSPVGAIGLDLNRNGKTDVIVAGADRNLDGIPDALQQPQGPPVNYTFDTGRLSPGLANSWDDLLRGQQGSWETIVRQHREVRNECRLLEKRNSELEVEILNLEREIKENAAKLQAGGRLQPTTLQTPKAATAVDTNNHGRVDTYVVGADRDRNGIPDVLQQTPYRPPMAIAGLDVNRDGRADAYVVGRDYNRDGMPDAVQQVPPRTPMATVGLDMNLDGKTDVLVTGSDRSQDGIPYEPQGQVASSWLRNDDPVVVAGERFRLEQAINIHPAQVHSAAMHANNSWIATASWDATVKLFDLNSKSVVRTLGDAGDCNMAGLYSVAFSKTMPDILGCTSADQNAYIWNYRTGKVALVLSGHTNEVNGIDFHPTQEVVATASDDCTCIVWDVAENQQLRALDQHTKSVYGCVFMGTENQYNIATCSFDHNTRIFDMRNKDMVLCLQTHQDDITGIDYSSSKQLIATGSDDGKISFVCTRQQRLLTQIDVRVTQPENEVKRVRFSFCGSLLAAACSSGKVLVYDVSEFPAKQVAVLSGHADCVFDVAWGASPSGARMLISASHDYSCGYWKEVI